MYLPTAELHQTTTLAEASELLQRFGSTAKLLAGGTDLLVDLKVKRVTAEHIISINRIDDLKGVTLCAESLRIGALTTITELDESPLVRDHCPAIQDATKRMAVRQVRNLATVGGNLASAVSCADLPPVFIAMNATVALWSPRSERLLPLEQFFLGPRRTARREDEILSAVEIPIAPPGFGAAYARFGLREGNAIAVAAVAAGLRLAADGTIEDARVVLGAVSPIPKLATKASELLLGSAPADELFAMAAELATTEADPISDVRGSAEFRRVLIRVLTARALAKALRRVKGQDR